MKTADEIRQIAQCASESYFNDYIDKVIYKIEQEARNGEMSLYLTYDPIIHKRRKEIISIFLQAGFTVKNTEELSMIISWE